MFQENDIVALNTCEDDLMNGAVARVLKVYHVDYLGEDCAEVEIPSWGIRKTAYKLKELRPFKEMALKDYMRLERPLMYRTRWV